MSVGRDMAVTLVACRMVIVSRMYKHQKEKQEATEWRWRNTQWNKGNHDENLSGHSNFRIHAISNAQDLSPPTDIAQDCQSIMYGVYGGLLGL